MPQKKTKEEQEEEDRILKKWEKIQNDLKKKFSEKNMKDFEIKKIKLIGGVDVSFDKGNSNSGLGCYVVLSYPELKVVYKRFKVFKTNNKYIPGFLAFREYPVLTDLIQEQKKKEPKFTPQVLFVDGNGKWHFREFGLASHLGVLIEDIPTIGISKKLLNVDGWSREDVKDIQEDGKNPKLIKFGDYEKCIGKTNGKEYGAIFRSKGSKIPIFISVGNNIDLETAIKITQSTCQYRIPAAIRAADLISRDEIRTNKKNKQ